MLNICIVFAQLEHETIQKRVTDAYYSRNKKGFLKGGRVPYGFRLEPIMIEGISTSYYAPIEKELEQIELIYNLYTDGIKEDGSLYSFRDILNYLIDNDIPHLRGGYWTVPLISSILSNPSYAIADLSLYEFFDSQAANIINPVELWEGGNGCYLYQGTVSKSKSKNDLKDKEIVLALHKGRIPSHIWIECRLRCMNRRQMATTNKTKSSWLVGKVKCGNCGKSLQISPSRISKKTGKQIRYMNCSFKYTTRGLGCKGTESTLYADHLESYVLDQIKARLEEFEGLKENDNHTNP
ncbi:recombinase family protein [Cuneatibacter sp. NSJ-177]|uniref:recombinase zinc beta ribbon domain-containing protein n=1 Tax=Cuneatibacter sp. NSJ-177 TaxID=2931401 RepID=UPI001FD17574|nr:recombinase family protein [Cuneatibacter sp. NSJ-177]MCJ7836007.1 recombinase family protein [Cuneatibacter sp. NSJ-177]